MDKEVFLVNARRPGLPDYTGPDAGMACGVHHDQLIEYCYSFRERLAYTDWEKPEHERASRRRHLCLILPEDVPEIPLKTWSESERLRAESERLWAQSVRLGPESERLKAGATSLWAKSDYLRLEADRLLEPYRAPIERAWRGFVPECRWDSTQIVFD